MRPSLTPISMPQPLEQRTQADCTQRFDDALVEAEIANASGDAPVFDKKGTVTRHAGDDGLLLIHATNIPEARNEETARRVRDEFLGRLRARRDDDIERLRAPGVGSG